MQTRARGFVSVLCGLALVTAAGCSRAATVRPGTRTTEATGRAAAPPAARDSVVAERDSLTRMVRAASAGRETEPATQVFENVRVLTTNVSAGNLIQAMNFYGAALGVSCTHCHVVGRFAADDKPQKGIARDMMRMNGVINGQLLKGITGLRSPNPSVNCVTCHRGQVIPARSLPSSR